MKRVFGILFCFMLLLSGTSVSFAQSEKTKPEKTEETTPKLAEQASSAIVIEQDTG
ncbi:D-alanyl-D-alanine carboxypeptidase, partial [Bacillus cereus]|nr:D-alanyl-D-alanine carboxypeptidase [Bacillus cereus]